MHSVQYLLPHSVPELSPTWGHQTELDQCNIQPCSKCFSVEIMFFHALYETPMAPGRWRLMQGLTSPDSYSHNGSLFYLLQGIASNWMKKGKQIEIKLYVSKQTVIKWAGWTFIYISTGFEPSPFWESKKVWLIFFLFGLLCISLLSIVTKRRNAGKLQAALICCFWPGQKQDKLEMSCKFHVWCIPSSGLHTQKVRTRWR